MEFIVILNLSSMYDCYLKEVNDDSEVVDIITGSLELCELLMVLHAYKVI